MNIDVCLEWALSQEKKLPTINGTGKGTQIRNLQPVPNEIREKRKEILAPFPTAFIEPVDRDYLVILKDGECVNRHVDTTHKGYQHLRLSWFLSVPDVGGEFWYGTQRIETKVDGVYIIDATIPHHVSVVKGETPLVVISFGIIVPNMVST